MGANPAKFFPWPTPYGQSPDTNVLVQAQAAPKAPLNNFIPLTQPDPNQQPTQGTQSPAQGQLGGTQDFQRSNIYGYGGRMQRMRNLL